MYCYLATRILFLKSNKIIFMTLYRTVTIRYSQTLRQYILKYNMEVLISKEDVYLGSTTNPMSIIFGSPYIIYRSVVKYCNINFY